MNEQPIQVMWDGEAFVPANPHWARRADEQFVVGERYAMVEHHERSSASHAHYFATLHDLWLNLPEHVAPQFPTAEHLRKHALIATGYADRRSIVCSSAAEARRIAAFIAPSDTFAVVKVDAATITVWTAQSQAMKAMGKKAFQQSKDDVLGWCADRIGLPADAEQRRAA
jgi:hypothetical protein